MKILEKPPSTLPSPADTLARTGDPPALEVSGLSKTFGRGKSSVHAVRGVDFEVAAGQVYGFLGPNGAGKSTTIRMIMDLVRPDAGLVRVFGQDVRALRGDTAPPALRAVGALVEGALFYEHLTGRKNLEVLARTRGHYSPDEIEALLERLGMADRADRPVQGYSMGMKQRLGVVAALLGRPRLVILDEPTNGLDPAGIREMRRFIRQLTEDGMTVFLSSHLLAEIEQVCDRVAIIHQGRIVREGRVETLLAEQEHLRLEVSDAARASEILSETWPCAPEAPQRGTHRALTARGESQPNARTRHFSSDRGEKSQEYWWSFENFQRRAGEKEPIAARLDFCHGLLRLEAPREATPIVIRRLLEARIDIFEARRERRSLEDFFMEVTAGADAQGESHA